jgi:hypothetical protein
MSELEQAAIDEYTDQLRVILETLKTKIRAVAVALSPQLAFECRLRFVERINGKAAGWKIESHTPVLSEDDDDVLKYGLIGTGPFKLTEDNVSFLQEDSRYALRPNGIYDVNLATFDAECMQQEVYILGLALSFDAKADETTKD